jgi:Flp pilus assembly protein TadD
MPEDAAGLTARAKATYLDAIRDWVRNGTRSLHAFTTDQARAHLPALSDDVVTAQALFRLGQALIRRGEVDEGNRRIKEASRLHPDSWCIWRQGAPVTEQGLAAQGDFWQRVDSLGERRYYSRVDMAGMP